MPGIIFLEIDGLALPVLQRAMRDGNVPEMNRWLSSGTHRLTEWETDLSSQTGASQAGILLGSNENIPAFRWVEKETGKVMTCSSPSDCEVLEQRHATGDGLLINDGASRGNLFSGEADAVILTVSRMSAEKKANPGLPRVLRQRLQRHARAGPVRMGGDARAVVGVAPAPSGRPSPRRAHAQVPAAARRPLRGRSRPDRVRRADGHDARPSRRVRDVLEL